MPTFPPPLDRALELCRVDFEPAPSQPGARSVLVATAVAIIGSLLADAVLVAAGKAVFPATKGYQHYRFGDYSKLTVIGVIIACIAWPVVTRITSQPRWLFVRLAVVVSAVLLLPDAALLVRGDSAQAVLVLVFMHLAIAVVTYQALVRLAPARSGARRMVSAGR
ncbi:DUF6069 family protein [Acidiferrimicrobium sp. IK]|uniref:DUF6069 family protein n=1 Tax=Acidiferrimicrobium sp. IK TaxID=2871700 RepID=UPI0021CB08E5|nr:DUF6069 family protein [Acidiferrimicrobium sp. IK]MCU4187004.1 DUF6069 family protein [Acidiferrimicrobium sp. IK]